MILNVKLAILLVPLGALAQQAAWGQCGGNGWSGATTCVSGYTCTKQDDWYSQCKPGTGGGGGVSTTIVTSTRTSAGNQPTSAPGSGLDAKFKARGKKYFGVATDQSLLQNAQNAAILKQHFGQVTPENSMKWQSIENTRGSYQWGGADYLMNYATTNDKIVRGHTLIWHSQLPSWVSNVRDKTSLTSVINTHVATVMGRWKGKIYAWDVVNEVLSEQGGLRQSVFSDVLGEDFIRIAFVAARAADPNAKLYINDYNIHSVTYAKTTGMANYVKKWLAAGWPIDGIGSQAHLQPGEGSGMTASINLLANTGVSEVAITELDIVGGSSTDYVNTVNSCLNQVKCVGITVWGIRDSDSWLGTGKNPLLFDANYQAKANFNAIMAAL